MRKDLTIPPCTYCGGPTYPVGKKKLETTTHFYCSIQCEEKWETYQPYMSKITLIKDFALKEATRRKAKTAIDLQHTSGKIAKEDTVILFSDSTYSFKLTNEARKLYSELLGNKANKDLQEVSDTISAIISGKEVILKDV